MLVLAGALAAAGALVLAEALAGSGLLAALPGLASLGVLLAALSAVVLLATLAFDVSVLDADDGRLSLIYQPEPLNTMPAG